MKKFIQTLILLVAFATSNVAISAPVSVEKAKIVAINFFKTVDGNSSSISLVYTRENAFYVFGNKCGWVIVSADDRVIPLIAYSTENSFIVPENENDTICGNNFWGMMKNIEDQIKFVVDNTIPATSEIENQWVNLTGSTSNKSPATVVPPLLTTTWNQDWPYNAMCPTDTWGPGGHVYAGCVATAMAQIMKYHNWPSQGLGSYGYTWQSYPYSGANFGTTTYNWANMPNSISSVNTDVATIIYHAGVATRSMWGSSSTGVLFTSNDDPVTTGFINYFKMAFSSIKAIDKINYTDTDWHNLIQSELNANRPVYYRGDGSLSHAWVCDGVDASNMYHFNFGWGGMYNGYFLLTNINPGSNNLTSNQAAIIGIKPNDGSTLVVNTTWSGTMTKTTNVAVPDAITLTVSPGAVISFGQDCKLQVWGKISSIGTSSNYAKLTASNQTNGWDGIDIKEDYLARMADNDTSKLIYTQVEWSKSSGIYCYQYGKVLIDHCKVNDNSGGYGGGLNIWYQPVNITNSQIYTNHVTVQGGGIYFNYDGFLSTNISSNDIHNNISDIDGGGFWFFGTTSFVFSQNLIHNNQAIKGAGGALSGGSPTLVNNKFTNNISSSTGGGLYLENCSAKIINNLIANNSVSTGAGGAMTIASGSNPILLNNALSQNYASNAGGCVNVTTNSNPTFKNCILFGNTTNGPGNQVVLGSSDSDPFFDHCDIEGGLAGIGGPGAGGNYTTTNYTNNIDSNPIFVSPSAGVGSGYNGLTANWQLQSSSPCINTGDTTGVSQYLPNLDLAGNPRINGIIDMGAYEYGCQVPAQPSSITGNANPCQTSSQVYSVTNIAGVIYTWSVPVGSSITAGQGTNSITVTIGSTNGNISVVPSNACGNGTSQNLGVTVNPLPGNAGIINGPSNICRGTNGMVYTVPVIANASTYNWTVPSGFTIIAGTGTNSITVDVNNTAVSGNISVYASNSCGDGQSSTLSVAAHWVDANAGNDQTIQYGTSTTLSGSASNGSGNYTWAWQPTALLINANIQNPTTVNLNSATVFTLTVSDLQYSCTSTDNVTVSITGGPLSVNAVANPDTICEENSSQLDALASGGSGTYTYSWTSNPVGFTSNLQNPVVFPTITTTYIVVVNDGFNTTSDNVEVAVNHLPTTPDQPVGPDSVDLHNTLSSIYTTNPITNADYYLWEITPSNAGSLSSGNGTSVTVTWDLNYLGNCSLTVKAVNNCGQSQASIPMNIYVDNTTSIDEVETININIFPNPCNGRFTISSDKNISEVYLYDVCGKRVSHLTNLADNKASMDCNSLPKGLYFVHVYYMGTQNVIKKVIIK